MKWKIILIIIVFIMTINVVKAIGLNVTEDLRDVDLGNFIGTQEIKDFVFDGVNDIIYGAGGTGTDTQFFWYNHTTDRSIDLSSRYVANWVVENPVNTIAFDSNVNLIYLGFDGGKFGRYNMSSNGTQDLSATDVANWMSAENIFDICVDTTNNLEYLALTGGNFGKYNLSSNGTQDLKATDIGNWIGTTDLNAVACDNINNIVYFAGSNGVFGWYNQSTNTTQDLRATDTNNWIGNSKINKLSFDSKNSIIYLGGANGIFGYYNMSSNTTLNSSRSDGWLNSININVLNFDNLTNMIYIGGTSGKYGSYNFTSNYSIDLSNTDNGDWIGTSAISAIAYNFIHKLIYFGGISGVFGVYNITNNTASEIILFPRLNATLNDTTLILNDGVNLSGNASDDVGLSFCQFITNITGSKEFFNKSISGTDASCTQNFTIGVNNAQVNLTLIVNDTINQKNQSSFIIRIGDVDNPFLVNCTLEKATLTSASGNTNKFNCTANDTNSVIKTMKFDINGTLNITRTFSFTQAQSISPSYTIFESSETLIVGSYSIMNVTVIDLNDNTLVNTTSFHWTVTQADAGGGGGVSGGGGGGGGGLPQIPQCKENETLVSNECVSLSTFNISFKIIGLTNIQPIVFYRTCGGFQEFRQLIKTNKIIKSAEFDKKQLNTNITIMGSEALIIKKFKIAGISQRIDMGNLKLIDTTQRVARVFITLRVVSLCNPLTYLFIIIPISILIFRKQIIKQFKK